MCHHDLKADNHSGRVFVIMVSSELYCMELNLATCSLLPVMVECSHRQSLSSMPFSTTVSFILFSVLQ